MAKYILVVGQLYKRGFSFPLLQGLGESEAERVLKEIHEGGCGSHIGGRALTSKIARAGFYWSTFKKDSLAFVKKASQVSYGGNGLLHQKDRSGASGLDLD
ncbi:hypothetical protein CR513_31467, partial [Mucuna pruriens]